MWPGKDIFRGNEISAYIPPAYSSGTLDNERLFGFEAAREKTKLKRLFPDYVFINNLDSFNGSYLVKFFLDQKYGVLPESVTEIVDHLPETQPEGESEEFSYTAKQYPKKSGSTKSGSTKSGSTKSGSTKSGSTKSGSNSSLMGVGSNFWDPEDERYGEVDIGALSVEEYIQMIDIPNTEGRLEFVKQIMKEKNVLPPQPNPITEYSIIGTIRDKNSDVHGIKMVVPKCCEDPSTFIKSVQQCYTVIFDISEDPSEICEAHTALDVMLQEASKKGKDACPRKFILVTSAVTWSLTKKRKDQNIVEEDIKRRNIYPKKYSLHVALEDYVMEAGAKHTKLLKTFVVCCGVPYGYEENLLSEYFRYAWSSIESVPLCSNGNKKLPLIHIQDLSTIIYSITVGLEVSPRYIFAVEKVTNTQENNIKALASAMKIDTNHCDSMGLFRSQIYIKNQLMAFLKADLPLYPAYLTRYIKMKWFSDLSFKDNIENIVLEYITSRNLSPLKILVFGQPGVGKTRISTLINKIYKTVYFDVAGVINNFFNDLHKLIENVTYILNFERRKKRIHATEELNILTLQLENFIEVQYPFIAKRAKAKQVCDLDLAVLSRSLRYLEMERTWNYGNLPDNVVAQMIRLRLNEASSLKCGYVLDGYPKTFEQATLLFPDMKFAWPDNYDKPQPVPKQESNEIKGDQDVEIPIPKPALDCNPNTVIFLEGTPELIIDRIVLSQSKDGECPNCARKDAIVRFKKYRKRITALDNIINFFEYRGLYMNRFDVGKDNTPTLIHVFATITMRLGDPTNISGPKKLNKFRKLYSAYLKEIEDKMNESKVTKWKEIQFHTEVRVMDLLKEMLPFLESIEDERAKFKLGYGLSSRVYLNCIWPVLLKGIKNIFRRHICIPDAIGYLAYKIFLSNSHIRKLGRIPWKSIKFLDKLELYSDWINEGLTEITLATKKSDQLQETMLDTEEIECEKTNSSPTGVKKVKFTTNNGDTNNGDTNLLSTISFTTALGILTPRELVTQTIKVIMSNCVKYLQNDMNVISSTSSLYGSDSMNVISSTSSIYGSDSMNVISSTSSIYGSDSMNVISSTSSIYGSDSQVGTISSTDFSWSNNEMLGETQYSSVSEEEIIFDEYYDSMSEHVCPHSDNALLHEDKIDRSSESSNAGEAEFEIGASSEQLSWCSLHIEDEDYGLFGVLPELYPFEEVGEEREYIPNEVLEE